MNYRILSDQEAVRAGDEFRIPLVQKWHPAYPDMVGKTRETINAETPGIPCRYAEFRRPLPEVKPAMKLVYVAGPFRGKSAWDIECNIRRAEALALEVWRLGAAALCPHANTRFFQNAAPDEVWLEGDLEMLRRCDAVMLTVDWFKSPGAQREVKEAREKGIPVFTRLTNLQAWLACQQK